MYLRLKICFINTIMAIDKFASYLNAYLLYVLNSND